MITPIISQTNAGVWNEMEFASQNTADPYDDTVHHEQINTLHAELQRMHKTCRQSIHMFYMKHLSYKQMSEILGITVNTVGSRLSKCLSKLKTGLKNNPQFKRTD